MRPPLKNACSLLPMFQHAPTTQMHAPSPTSATPRPPSRVVDDDDDESITESLLTLSQYRVPEMQAPSTSPFRTTSRFFTRDTRLHLETCANQLRKVLSVAHLFH
ncbi:hypothetical protein M405DRAFT_810814 [Rhizopogon salebrosus TDB-379]|nr:hypothetical protein M405DRAFT_810814 [Rhizopogon salebrosus TDB-379]